MRARDVMTGPAVTVGTATPVTEALRILAEHGFTALPVVDDADRLAGIVTEADLLRGRVPQDVRFRPHGTAAAESAPPPGAVGEVMTEAGSVASVASGTDVAAVVSLMLGLHHRTIPVVDGGRVVGVVTRRDLVRALSRDDEELAREVRRRLTVYGGPDRWDVAVTEGVAHIADVRDDAQDRHVATLLAESVPGIVHAETRHRDESRTDA